MLIHGSLGVSRELGWKEQDWRIQDKEAWGRGVCEFGGVGVMRARLPASCIVTVREHWPKEQHWIRGSPGEGNCPPSRKTALPWLQWTPDHGPATQYPLGLLHSPPDLQSADSFSQSRVCSSDVSFSAFFFIKSPPLLSLT